MSKVIARLDLSNPSRYVIYARSSILGNVGKWLGVAPNDENAQKIMQQWPERYCIVSGHNGSYRIVGTDEREYVLTPNRERPEKLNLKSL